MERISIDPSIRSLGKKGSSGECGMRTGAAL